MAKSEASAYYSACAMLWTVLGVGEYIFDSIEPDPRSPEGYTKSDVLVAWLLDQIMSADECRNVETRELESLSDHITFEWARRLISFAEDASARWDTPKSIALYYHLTMLELEALSIYQEIISGLSPTSPSHHFEDKQADFGALVEHLRTVMHHLEIETGIHKNRTAEMQAVVRSLAEEWTSKARQFAQCLALQGAP